MQVVSAEALAAIAKSHIVTTRARITLAGKVVAGTDLKPSPLALTSGEVAVDRSAEHVRSFSASLIDYDGLWIPRPGQQRIDPALTPLIELWRGLKWPLAGGAYGFQEWSLGQFVIDECDVDRQGSAITAKISGPSLSGLVGVNRFTTPWNIASTKLYSDAIKDIITDRLAQWGIVPVFNFEASTKFCPDMTLDDGEREDPWKACQDLALADAKELFCSPPATFVLRTVPDPQKASPSLVLDDNDGTILLRDSASRRISAASTYNGVIVNGSAPWLITPVQGVAWDTDPNSPTYYLGPFGQRAKTITDAVVADQAQATAAAAAQLPNVLGSMEDVTLSTVPLGALDGGDVIKVNDVQLGVDNTVLLESFRVPLGPSESMQAQVKARRKV